MFCLLCNAPTSSRADEKYSGWRSRYRFRRFFTLIDAGGCLGGPPPAFALSVCCCRAGMFLGGGMSIPVFKGK